MKRNLKESPRRDGPKRAGLYARVSTDAQLDNTSPDAQLARARAYCQSKGYIICGQEIEAIGGSFVLARSKLNKYLDLGAAGKLDVIVVDIPDRLGRGDAIAKCELLAQMNNLTVEYASPGRDTSTVEGFIQKSAEQMVSGIERINIGRRTKGGRRDRAAAGMVIETGLRPYGYRFESTRDERGRKTSCRLVIVEEEAQIVRQMFEWLVFDQVTVRGIAKRLSDMRVPTPKDNRRKFKGIWDNSGVYRMITNKTYAGEWRYGKALVEREDTAQGIRHHFLSLHREDAIPVKVPAIVSLELWERAQVQLVENGSKFRKPTRWVYPLRGRVKCVLCNTFFAGQAKIRKSGYVYRYYRCAHNRAFDGPFRCQAKTLNAEEIEAAVWECVKEGLSNETRLFKGINAMRAERDRERRNLESVIASTQVQIGELRAKIARYLDLFGDGGMTKEEYEAKRKEINAKIAKQEAECSDYQLRLANCQVLEPAAEEELKATRREILAKMDWGTPEQRSRVLEMCRVKCFYDDRSKELNVTGLIGARKRILSTSS